MSPSNGDAAFRCGDYPGAISAWQQALVERPPDDGMLLMLLGQAYFAAGSYHDATVATQAAMRSLPADRWGIVVGNLRELYGILQQYDVQLRQLKTAVAENPTDCAQRFLLGFHYAFLGYPQSAVAELDKVVELNPQDELAAQLRALVLPRLPSPGAPVITPGSSTFASHR